MLPSRIGGVTTNMVLTSQPSLTYRLNDDTRRIVGKVDGIEAIKIAISKMMTTERYSRVIYSGQYGIELEKMIGKDYDYIKATLEKTVLDALMIDDRIIGIENFNVNQSSLDKMEASFIVKTIFGEIDFVTEVTVA